MPRIIYGGDAESRWLKVVEIYPIEEYTYIAVPRKTETYGIDDVRQFKKSLTLQRIDNCSVLYYFQEPGVMTDQAQQAMLLLLEELPPGVRVVFLSDSLGKFLPTVISRSLLCQVNLEQGEGGVEIPTGDLASSFKFAAQFAEKEEVKRLLVEIIEQLRPQLRKKKVRDAVGYLRNLYKEISRTNVSPRVVAELAVAVFQRVRLS